MFERRKMSVLALSETKMKGRSEMIFGRVRERISGVIDGRGREGVALLLSEDMCVCSGMEGVSKIYVGGSEDKE